MDLLTKILNCQTEKEIDEIIKTEINKLNNSSESIEQLGFLDSRTCINYHKGFIPFETRIKYSSINMETYSMKTTDFFYEFAHNIKKRNITTLLGLINYLETFINSYFGLPGKINRETIFNDIAWNTTTTDEEYFAALENNKIGDLKGKGAAECTERSAVVQQILSLFGIESYYCIGCVGLEDRQEAHCFNIIKRAKDYVLLDYSIPVIAKKEDGTFNVYLPFISGITNEDFDKFINNKTLKEFQDYEYIGKERKLKDTSKKYIVGAYEIEKGIKM